MGAHFGFAFYNLDIKKKGPGSKLMKEFEGLKRDFGRDPNVRDFRIDFHLKGVGDSNYYDAAAPEIIISRFEKIQLLGLSKTDFVQGRYGIVL